MDEYDDGNIGLSTIDALERLEEELSAEVAKYKDSINARRFRHFLSAFNPNNVTSPFHYTSLLQLTVFVLCLITAFVCIDSEEYNADIWWPIEVIIIIFCILINTFLIGYLQIQKKGEFMRLAQTVISVIHECREDVEWSATNYPQIYSPLSPCVSLQWTYRDGEVVNLPACLLVRGDVILVRPGHRVAARCHSVLGDADVISAMPQTLERGEQFIPSQPACSSPNNPPYARKPVCPAKFIVEETPFLSTLRSVLDTDTDPPTSVLDNERHIVGSVWVERRVFTIVMAIILACNCVRFIYFGSYVGHWAQLILIVPVHALLPLVSLLFPVWWTLVRYLGQARLLSAFDVIKHRQSKLSGGNASFDCDHPSSGDKPWVSTNAYDVWRYFMALVHGDLPRITRRVDLFHTLGTITSFCCVDKKGILSWPNPTAEKVFFMTPPPPHEDDTNKVGNSDVSDVAKSKHLKQCNFEVLDLTHNSKNSFNVQFDNPDWQAHLSSLKPIGLNILLNTCNMKTVEWYTQFTDHVACAATKNDEIVAVINRRCLCELARQIGFKQKAAEVFELRRVMGLYQQVPPEESAKERLNRAHSMIQHKIPMPNMVSAVVKHHASESQLMTQGTADLILDCCTDYWDGHTLHPLTRNDRKKILDFHHRTSLAAYCTAFSYMPLLHDLPDDTSNLYTELPNRTTPHIIVTGSELSAFAARSCEFGSSGETDSKCITDAAKIQSCQTFLGLVTMQYQARQDVVHLIDQLDLACIRFVHFSEENELRSRVFSEKMGLEAGWNCHISLKANKNYEFAMTSLDTEAFRKAAGSYRLENDFIEMGGKSAQYANVDDVKCTSHSYLSESKLKTGEDDHGDDDDDDDDDDESVNDDEKVSMLPSCGVSVLDMTGGSSDDDHDIGIDHMSSYVTLQTSDSQSDVLDNRANLPCGIENIRPHLESVDNVPLLVNLFTDCSPHGDRTVSMFDTYCHAATTEMIQILQEHGEVVLCLGSSLNADNTPVFLRADISIAVEPLHPQICAKYDVFVDPWDEGMMTPAQLAAVLNSMPCSLVIGRSENINFSQLIAHARHLVMSSRSCFQLMFHFHLSLSLIQLVSSLLQLPPVLSGRHIVWFLVLVIPALSFAVLHVTFDPRLLVWATGKNLNHITRETLVRFGVSCACRITASIVPVMFSFGYTSYSACLYISMNTTNCNMYVGLLSENGWNPWIKRNEAALTVAQNIVMFQLTLNFAVTSLSFLHKYDQIWVRVPFTNLTWISIVSFILVLQVVYCIVDVTSSKETHTFHISAIPSAVSGITFLWPLFILAVNELIKRKEIKQWARYQKRCRLNFGTKLGMNSPF